MGRWFEMLPGSSRSWNSVLVLLLRCLLSARCGRLRIQTTYLLNGKPTRQTTIFLGFDLILNDSCNSRA